MSAEVGLLLSEVAKGSVETVVKTNKLIYAAKQRKDHKMVIQSYTIFHPTLSWDSLCGRMQQDKKEKWQLNPRVVLGHGTSHLAGGAYGKVTPISWHATKIERVVRSPGAAEAAAVVNGEDLLIIGPPVDVFDINTTVNRAVGGSHFGF